MKKNNAPTRRDVAELAGVSDTVVSYVLNNNRAVSEEKRRRVLDAVAQLGYRPNANARALRGKGSNHILIIADTVANDYFGKLLQTIGDAAYASGYLVSLMGTRNNRDFVMRILASQADAVIISSTAMGEEYVQMLIDSGLPVVLLMTRDYAGIRGRAARIYTGVESGMMAAVYRLYSTNCRHIVYVDRVSASGHFSTRQDLRFRGFCNQMEALGLPLTEQSVVTGCTDEEQLFDAVCRRVMSGEPLDAFVCRNDRYARITLSAVLACGKKVPEDISVIGFDDTEIGRLVRPALSTVKRDLPGIADAVLQMISDMLNGEAPQEIRFLTQLVLRDTTR